MTRLQIIAAAIGVTLLASPAFAQVSDRDGWSQPSVNGGQYGQRRDGVQWQSRDVNGTQYYSDSTGRHCWTQSDGSGGSFNSCR